VVKVLLFLMVYEENKLVVFSFDKVSMLYTYKCKRPSLWQCGVF
jgi:hypothetical protein